MKPYSSEEYVPYNSINAIVPIAIRIVNPTSVVDIGCGRGAWLKSFMNHGITDVIGVDGKWMEGKIVIPKDKFIGHDLTHPLELNRRFDLAVCLEFAEHIGKEHSSRIVSMLTSLSHVVMFSAAIPGQDGDHHVNEQWPDYWAALFAKYGYVPVDTIRGKIWNDSRVDWAYAQNTIFFVDSVALVQYPSMTIITLNENMLSIVHPKLYAAKCVAATRWYIILKKIWLKVFGYGLNPAKTKIEELVS